MTHAIAMPQRIWKVAKALLVPARPPKIERYIVRNGHEWAFFYLDEQYGTFLCQSSYGTYAYIWRSIGSRTLKQFLADLNFDYFMGKARPDYRMFDADRTVDAVKEMIIRARRDEDTDSVTAREAWRDLDYCTPDNPGAFLGDFTRSEALMEIVGSDYTEICRECPDGNSRGFWERIWPGFIEQIRAAR